uniref:NADH dehydrogenase subunit 4L n=1 Tax=Plectotropis elegantissima TaxID=244846 RepID=Q75YN9_9EUPU|nr:NADH dehydrogenase subunit 4L [Plectotropis elegantissima]
MDSYYVCMYTVLLLILNLTFFVGKKTLLMMLISLEVLMFMVIMLSIGPFLFMYKSLTFFTVLLCFAAGGAAIGLSMLITFSRHTGNDLIKSSL